MIRLAIALIIALLSVAAMAPAQDPVPAWPLDLESRYLTSNFMERRPGRWHAGLDLKTETVTGFPVLAVEDGWISRIRAEAGAYGRVVYLVGNSGKTYVYAHLERFSDVVREYVDADRERHGRYRVRLTLAADDLRVTAGQVLGLSGQSGTSGPHLHFEVRDDRQRPLNPLDWGFAMIDTFAPLIRQVTAHPARPGAIRDAGARAVSDPLGLTGILDTLVVAGPVAFSAAITDQGDIRGHTLEPWLIEVKLDGDLVYRCRNESFAFSENNVQRLEWCEIRDPDGKVAFREHWLHRRAGVDLAGRQGGRWFLGSAGQGLVPGDHLLEISAADRHGGRAVVRVPLRVETGSPGTTAIRGWPETIAAVSTEGGGVLTPFFDLADSSGTGVARRVLDPSQGDPVLAPTVLWIQRIPQTVAYPVAPGLTSLRWQIRYLAADWPLDSPLRVDLAAAPDWDDAWIFRLGRKDWQPVGRVRKDPDGTAWFELSEPGLHAAFRDVDGPSIPGMPLAAVPQEPSDVPGVTMPRWQTVPLEVLDRGTGVDPATIDVRLDGVPLIVEPDLIRDRILVTVPDATAAGEHSLEVTAEDRAGNRTVARLGIVCR